MIWSPYEFFGAGGLTNSAGCDILWAKTATPPNISDTFSDTLGGIQYKVNNPFFLSHTLNNSISLIHIF
jgi:hypothetical protein